MEFKNFSTPHCHVASLDSASTAQAFADREVELGTGTITITDHGSLAACQTVYELARKGIGKNKVKLTPILGLEGYHRDDNCPILEAAGTPKTFAKGDPESGTYRGAYKYGHFTTHFLDQEAFRVGIKLLSKAKIEQHGSEAKPIFDWAAMEELGAANVTMTTGCLIGVVPRHLLDRGAPDVALQHYERMRSLVRPGHFYVEAFPHVCTHNYVKGVFLTLKNEEPEDSAPYEARWWPGKTLRTDGGDIKAEDLVNAFKHKNNKHTKLLAVKDRQTWVDRPAAKILAVKQVDDFVENECVPYDPTAGTDVQLAANRWMIEQARRHGDPILISDDSHHAYPDEKVVQNVRLASSGWGPFYGSYHRQSSAEAWGYFHSKLGVDEKTFQGWIENSEAWAARFKNFKLEAKPSLPVKFYEAKYAEVGARNSLEYIMHLIKKHGRMNWKDRVMVSRLTQEISLLYRNGTVDLLPYFMIDEEVCDLYTKNRMLTGPGRGSAAGLLLTYLLGITHVDPIRYGLSLDRFLTLDRIKSGKLPDIDQDLPHRNLLVDPDDPNKGWLKERFGDHVAQISTVMTLKLSSAVLDVARFTLGKVPPDVAEWSRKFQRPPQGLDDHKFVNGYEDGGSWVAGSLTFDPALQSYVAAYPEQWKIVQKCLGLGRSFSRHACAYVIANRPIWEFIPLTVIGGVTCTQPTAGAVEALGGLKMDFLVINSLNDIAAAIQMIQQRSGMTIPEEGMEIEGRWVPSIRLVPYKGQLVDIWDLPSAQEVFAEVSTGKTETVFQFNTPGAVQWLRHFNRKKDNGNYAIDSIESMAAFTALDRPGPLDAFVRNPETEDSKHNMLVEFARRARGAEHSPDIFKLFDKLFPETHGIMVYQEQLQRAYQELTGCTGAEAEAFRGNVAKKLKDKIIAAYPVFMEGATRVLGSKEQAQAVWDFIGTWAAYGFNKSHAVCYVVIAYACAFLKHYYPLEWWTAVLRNADKEEINEEFWKHCGHLIELPDVTKATPTFEIQGERIQAPLSLLHGVGDVAHKELVEGAPFTSIRDLVDKIEARKNTLKPGKKTEKVKTEDGSTTTVVTEGMVKGRSALNKGIVSKLIVSGALDQLVPAGTSTLEILESLERARFDYENEQRAARKPKPKRPKKAPNPVPAELINLTQYTRYQLRKDILPAYSESVLKMMIERQHPRISRHGRGWSYHWMRPCPFAGPEAIAQIDAAGRLPENGFRVAVAAYVQDVRVFRYGQKKDREACDLTLDLDGTRLKFVRWPDKETGDLDEKFKEALKPGLKGALVILVLSKFREGKPFTIDDIEVVQPAPGAVEEPEPEESKE